MKLTRTRQRTPFEEILAEAVRVKLELQKYQNPRNPYVVKVSLEGMRQEALAAAKTTPERVTILREALDADRDTYPHAWAFIRRCAVEISGQNVGSLSRLTAGNPWLRVNGADAAAPELAVLNSTPLEAVVLAVEEAGKTHPENFGGIDDYAQWEKHMTELHERLQTLYPRIESEARFGQDLESKETGVRSAGEALFRITFTISGGAVALGPQAAERLINYLVTQSVALKQLGVEV